MEPVYSFSPKEIEELTAFLLNPKGSRKTP
jgi:hypothetical protein